MTHPFPTALALALIATPAVAAPSVDFVANAFGRRAGVHKGVARGALLAVLGQRIGPDQEVSSEARPVIGLGGSYVELTMGGQTYALGLVSAARTRVVALVPPETPPGAGQVTLTYAGEKTAPSPVEIVDYTFGLAS